MRRWLLTALIFAAPAGAQFAPIPRVPSPTRVPPLVGSIGPAAPGTWRDLSDVRERIADGRRSGQLSRREAKGLRRQANGIGELSDRYALDGLSAAEQRELDVRTQVLRDATLVRRSGVPTPAAVGTAR